MGNTSQSASATPSRAWAGGNGVSGGGIGRKISEKIGFFKALLLYLDLFKNESKRFDHGKTKNFLKIFWRTRT